MHFLRLALMLAAPGALAAAGDPYAEMGRQLAEAAKRRGAKTVVVLPFVAAGKADEAAGPYLAERMAAGLTGAGLQVLERSRYEELLKGGEPRSDPVRDLSLFEDLMDHLRLCDLQVCNEPGQVEARAALEGRLKDRALFTRKLLDEGSLDGRRADVAFDASVNGSFTALPDGRFEVVARMTGADDALVLGFTRAQVSKDWGDPPAPREDLASSFAGILAAAGVGGMLGFIARAALG